MIPHTITYRALEIMIANPEMDILDAVKQAIIEENKLLSELLENRTERAKTAAQLMCKRVYSSLN
jgi:hypothetical protein